MVGEAFRTWLAFRKTALRSTYLRASMLTRGVYVGEGTRIPGGGRLSFAAGASVQRLGVLNARTGAEIALGAGSRIGAFCVISAAERIAIGSDVLIADRVFISDHNHESRDLEIPVIRQGISAAAPVSIGDGCWLGINVCIMPGVTLGRNCIVGSGSVVTRSFPDDSVIGGSPARLLKSRRPEER